MCNEERACVCVSVRLWECVAPLLVLLVWLLHKCSSASLVLQVLLLDEVTVDMDVVARLDLLQFLRYASRPAQLVHMASVYVL